MTRRTVIEPEGAPMRRVLALLVVTATLTLVSPAAAAPPSRVILLPGAVSAEGVTAVSGTTFYAGDLFGGDIFLGDVRRGEAELFIDVPAGTQTVGMDLAPRHDLLFVAGGPVNAAGPGKAYVYDTRTRALVADYTVGSLINDVTVTPHGAWFTDSLQPKLYFVPIVRGAPGPVRTLDLTGPAAGDPGAFFVNGITATPSGRTLLVAPAGTLCTIDPRTGASELVAGVSVPSADGLVLEGRHLWAVQLDNEVSRWRLSADLTSGTKVGSIKDSRFALPVTAAKLGNKLAVVNSHLDTGFPPTHPTYEVVVVDAWRGGR
jgi:hypothetical protein